jgi:hypothetical protein
LEAGLIGREAGFRIAFVRVSTVCFLGLVPAALLTAFLSVALIAHHKAGSPQAIDFHTIWQAGGTYLHRRDPYPAALKDFIGDGPRQSFVYPAATAALVAPLAPLTFTHAAFVFLVLSTLAVALALWVLGVRDWRSYGAAFASPAVLTGISIGTLSPLLLLGCALAWRYRNSVVRCSLAVAAILAIKLFLWPLLLWLVVTGRRRTCATALAGTAALSVAAWAPIRFAGARGYPALLHRLGEIEGPRGYGVAALFPAHAGVVLAVLMGASVAAVAGATAMRARMADSLAFPAAIGLALFLSPILWLHYMALLPAMIAVLRPRFSLLWLAPVALWLTPQQGSYGDLWRVGLVALVAALALVGAHFPALELGSFRPAAAAGSSAKRPS